MGVTERPRSLDPSKAIAMAICPMIVHFSTWQARSMQDVACEFARAAVRSKDAQKQLARTSLIYLGRTLNCSLAMVESVCHVIPEPP